MADPGPLLRREMRDFRVADGAAEELTELQKQPWTVEVHEGGWDGLEIELTGPDGAQRRIAIEIDRGNVKVVTARDGADADAVVTIQADGTHVAAANGVPYQRALCWLLNERGVTAAPPDPTPHLADAPHPPTP